MKMYDKVKHILQEYPATRNSDKELIWTYIITGRHPYRVNYKNAEGLINRKEFFEAPSFEGITRARRKIQQLHTELRAVEPVEQARRKKELQKGTHVFREPG